MKKEETFSLCKDFCVEECSIRLIHQVALPRSPTTHTYETRKGLVINYGEGEATKWENHGSETFCAPPQDREKLFAPPLLKSGNFSCPPPTIWLNFQATA